MSTSIFAMTIIVEPEIKSQVFATANALMNAQPAVLQPDPSLRTFQRTNKVITQVRGSSRSDFFSQAVARLCTLASIKELEIFTGKTHTLSHWKLPLFEDSVAEFACGYWLEKQSIETTLDALDRLMVWAKSNAHQIRREELFNYFPDSDTDGILKAIEDGGQMSSSRMLDADPDGEGTGVAYLFAYLGTSQHLLRNALASGLAVLHVAEIYGFDGHQPQPFVSLPSVDAREPQHWLEEGDSQFEEAEYLICELRGADAQDRREAQSLLEDSIKCYINAIELNPQFTAARYGWASALCLLARSYAGKNAKEFWRLAISKFEEILDFSSSQPSNGTASYSKYNVFNRAGEALVALAQLCKGQEAAKYYKAAILKYEAALNLEDGADPEIYEVLVNCGDALYELSQISTADEAKSLLGAAGEKYAAGLKLLPDEPNMNNYAGYVLLKLAQCNDASDRERFLRHAKIKLMRAEQISEGSAAYSLACACALRGHATEAVSWLKVAALHSTLPSRKHIEGDVDLALIRSDPGFSTWFAELS
jgi:tetratricopeptide (TPR) repeat protein